MRPGLRCGVHDECAAAAEADGLGDGFEAPVAEDLNRGRVTRVVIKGEYRPGGLGELLAELTGQLLRQRAVVEGGFGQRCGRVGLAHPRSRESGGQRHAEVNVVQDDLEDGRDDRGSAGRADAEDWCPVAKRDDRSHAGTWLLAAGGSTII